MNGAFISSLSDYWKWSVTNAWFVALEGTAQGALNDWNKPIMQGV
jgi:hypothetical protein